jgi:hypothetical protein
MQWQPVSLHDRRETTWGTNLTLVAVVGHSGG